MDRLEEISHAARLSLSGKEVVYTLEPDRLVWRTGGQVQSLPYSAIGSVQLITYPAMGLMVRQCTVRGDGKSAKFRSHHLAGIGQLEDRTATYAPFVSALTGRIAAANPAARFIAGSSALWIAWSLIGIAGVVVAVLLVLAMLGGALLEAPALPAVLLILVGIPLALRQMRMGRAKSFDPANPDPHLLGKLPEGHA